MKEKVKDARLYTLFEVFRFNFFCCCLKKSARYEQYRADCAILRERLDILNQIFNQGYTQFMTEALMKPYQI